MILRLVRGPMLDKSNRIGPLVNRQKVLLTTRLRVTLFLRFSTTRETENFQKTSREFREIFADMGNLSADMGKQQLMQTLHSKNLKF